MCYYFRIFVVIFIIVSFCGCIKKERAEETKLVAVECIGSEEKNFENIVRVFGSVESVEYADISARVEGIVEKRYFTEGDKFNKGDLLFTIDRTKLENELKAAENDLKVAEANLQKSMIDVEILKIMLDKATADYERAKTLISTNAISQDKYEIYELTFQKTEANLKQAEAALALAAAARDKAESYLNIARKKFADSSEHAAFDGVVTKKYKEEGEYAKIGDKVLRIENPQNLEAISYLAAEFYHKVIPGETRVRVRSGEIVSDGIIYYKSPDIDMKTRTFKIKIYLPKGKFIIGNLCQIEIITEERKAFGVPSHALLERERNRKSIFLAIDNKAKEVEVKTGIEQDGWIEILEPDIRGAKIIISGQNLINSGDQIKIIDSEEKGSRSK